MAAHPVRGRKPLWLGAGLFAGLVLAAALLAPSLAAASPGTADVGAAPLAASSHPQWAFGGSAHGSLTCSSASCFGSNLTTNSTFTMSWKYYLEWVVIYTEINVSSTQTELESKTALNLTLSVAYTACTNVTPGQPCQTSSLSGSVSGRETASGATNITNGTVDVLAGLGSPGTVAAHAVTNASAVTTFNFSGSVHDSTPTTAANIGFVIGGSESSTVAFSTPLGLVPITPVTGQQWTSTAAYTASGKYVDGYSYSLSESGSTAISQNNWTHGSVAPTGILTVNGTALGPRTLYDNATSPPTQMSSERILLAFSGGNFSGLDGWLLGGTDIYHGLMGSVSSAGNFTSTTTAPPSTENCFYSGSQGFVGASLGANTSNLSGTTGTPNVNVVAGPEPVSLAEQQYQAITSNSTPGQPFPYLVVLVGVVAAAAVLGGVFLWRRNVHRRQPPAAAMPAPTEAAPSTGIPPPSPPTPPGSPP